jgi:hypothetical protein
MAQNTIEQEKKKMDIGLVASPIRAPEMQLATTNKYVAQFNYGTASIRVDILTKGPKADKIFEEMKKGSKAIEQLYETGLIDNIRSLTYGTVPEGRKAVREAGGAFMIIGNPTKKDFEFLDKSISLSANSTLTKSEDKGVRTTFEHQIKIGATGGRQYTFTLNLNSPAVDTEDIKGILKQLKKDSQKYGKMYLNESVITNVAFVGGGEGKKVYDSFVDSLKDMQGFERNGKQYKI